MSDETIKILRKTFREGEAIPREHKIVLFKLSPLEQLATCPDTLVELWLIYERVSIEPIYFHDPLYCFDPSFPRRVSHYDVTYHYKDFELKIA